MTSWVTSAHFRDKSSEFKKRHNPLSSWPVTQPHLLAEIILKFPLKNHNLIELINWIRFWYAYEAELASEWDFLFWARSKNPEIPRIGIGIWKSRKNPERKMPKIHGIRDFFILEIFIPGIRAFFVSGFLSPGFFFNFDNKIIRFFLISGYPDKKPPLLIKCLNIKNTYWYNAWFFVL